MRILQLKRIAVLITAIGLVSGCSEESSSDSAEISPTQTLAPTTGKPDDTGAESDKLGDGKADAWNYRNNPNGLRVEMNTKLADFPLTGETELQAWPDTYWPTYKDSSNQRWQSTGNYLDDLSPAEKYDVAFHGWDPTTVKDLRPFDAQDCSEDSFDAEYYEKLGPAAKYISKHKGNAKTREAALAGKLTDTCRAKEDGECMQACEEKPEEEQEQCERRCHRGGVETWWGLCHAWAPAAILEKEPLHPVTVTTEYGDVVFEVGDIKALYSVIYDRAQASLIGGRCNDFNVDRDETTGRITSSECRDLNAGSFHVAMSNLIGIQKRGFVEDRTFDYEVWNQPVKGYTVHTLEEITTKKAHELLKVDGENPTDCIDGADVGNGGYCYNTNIDKLFRVEATLHWVTESHASTVAEGAHNLARYSRTDRYTYIIEVKDGHVVGGEWYGSSIENHPDFIWLPFDAGSGNPYVNIQKVRNLGERSQSDSTATDEASAPSIITVEGNNVGLSIPDFEPAGVTTTLMVEDRGNASDASLTIDLTHTYVGDLIVTLIGPDGAEHVVHNKQGGSTDDIKKTFSVANVGEINGTWTLRISDNYQRDIGTLNTWKLDFKVGGSDESAETVREWNNTNVADIPDNDDTGIQSYIDITENGTIKNLEVTLDISHTYIADLVVTLKKGGITKTLHEREGGSSDDIQRSFSVSDFNGADSKGRWFLKIKDVVGQDVGSRNQWSMKITY